MGVKVNLLTNEKNFVTKIFFQIRSNEVLENCKKWWKNVKADVKQQEIKEIVCNCIL